MERTGTVSGFLRRVHQDVSGSPHLDVYVTVLLSLVVGALGVFNVVNAGILAGATPPERLGEAREAR